MNPKSGAVPKITGGGWIAMIVTIIVLVLFVITLKLMGRLPWGDGGIGFWTPDAWGHRTSQDMFDPYSFTHVLHGMVFYGLLHLFARRVPKRWRFMIALALEIAWEIFENSPIIINRYRAVTASLDYYGDSILNSFGDVLCSSFGFWIAKKFPVWITLLVFLSFELMLLLAVRDNLTLNTLMLLHPVPEVKWWQMGGV